MLPSQSNIVRMVWGIIAVLVLASASLLLLARPLHAEPLSQGSTPTLTPQPTAVNGGTYTLVENQVSAFSMSRLETDSNGLPVLLYADTSNGLTIIRCQDMACINRTGVQISIFKVVGAALDSQNRVVFTYTVESPNPPFGPLISLYIARCQDLDCTTFSTVEVIDSGIRAAYDAVGINDQDIPRFAYARSFQGDIYAYLTFCLNSSCEQAQGTGFMSSVSPLIVDLELDSQDVPVFTVVALNELHLIRCISSISCDGASAQFIARVPLLNVTPFEMILDSQDRPRIFFEREIAASLESRLTVAECADPGCTANTTIYDIDFMSDSSRDGFWNGGMAVGPNDELFIAYDRFVRWSQTNPGEQYLIGQRCLTGQCSARNLAVMNVNPENFEGSAGKVAYSNGTWLITYYINLSQSIVFDSYQLWLFSEPVSYPTPTPSATFTATITLTPTQTPTPTATLLPSRTPTPAPSSPPNTAPQRNRFTEATVTLTWLPVTQVSTYEIQVAADQAFRQQVFIQDNIPAGTLSATTFGLPNGLYYWRVRARLPNGQYGAWSAVESFIVEAASN